MRRRCIALLFLLIAPAHAQPPPQQTLVTRLRQLVDTAALGEQVGVVVIDVASGRPIFQYHADRPLNPASNMKLVTAAAALRLLGADFRMHTVVSGSVDGDRAERLVLRGSG